MEPQLRSQARPVGTTSDKANVEDEKYRKKEIGYSYGDRGENVKARDSLTFDGIVPPFLLMSDFCASEHRVIMSASFLIELSVGCDGSMVGPWLELRHRLQIFRSGFLADS